jgi:hypothetical protein
MQAAITKPAASMCTSAQLLTQHIIITATRQVAGYRPVRRYDPARQPLANIKQGLKMRGCFPLG